MKIHEYIYMLNIQKLRKSKIKARIRKEKTEKDVSEYLRSSSNDIPPTLLPYS